MATTVRRGAGQRCRARRDTTYLVKAPLTSPTVYRVRQADTVTHQGFRTLMENVNQVGNLQPQSIIHYIATHSMQRQTAVFLFKAQVQINLSTLTFMAPTYLLWFSFILRFELLRE